MVPSWLYVIGFSSEDQVEIDLSEHQADILHSVIQQLAGETGMTPPEVCLSWAHQREQKHVYTVSKK